MSRTLWVGTLAAVASACGRPAPSAPPPHRMQVRALGGSIVQFVPARDQLPYCLIYTQSEKGVTRQLTLTHANQSVPCPAGEPVLGLRYRIPADEGLVHVHVLFSDQRLEAIRVAEQVLEMAKPAFNPMNLVLPGKVVLDTQTFRPTEEPAAVVGAVVEPPPTDAGAPR